MKKYEKIWTNKGVWNQGHTSMQPERTFMAKICQEAETIPHLFFNWNTNTRLRSTNADSREQVELIRTNAMASTTEKSHTCNNQA